MLAALLSACATGPSRVPADFTTRQRDLAALLDWRVTGKIGVRQGDEGTSAQLSWQQRDEHFNMALSGPLGVGAIQIEGNSQRVTLHSKDGQHSAADPEELVRSLTGWTIPVSDLRFWARGLPSPNFPVTSRVVESGSLAQLSQGGWHIAYLAYTDVGRYRLPTRIEMSRPETRLTLLLKNWQTL
jgi:outer membrane lipoprotein LolB